MPSPEKSPSLKELLQAPSPQALARKEGDADACRFDNFYPTDQTPSKPSTTEAIDDFLNTYGQRSPQEDMLLERMIFNPVPDYATQLMAMDDELPVAGQREPGSGNREAGTGNRESGDRVIYESEDTTVENEVRTKENADAKKECVELKGASSEKGAKQPPESLLSESLAKIYIKTGRYSQAYEILNSISLRFPEKNRYFADQLRFLRKLIENQQRLEAQANRL